MIAVYKENIWCFLYISILVCANLKCFDLSKGVNFTPATLLGLELAPSSTDAGKSLQIKMSHLNLNRNLNLNLNLNFSAII